jgi:hypothetical protein
MKVVPGKIHEELIETCKYMQIAKIQGVCTEYIAFAPVEAEEKMFFVLTAPTDGPYDMFVRFAKTERTVETFEFQYYGAGPDGYIEAFRKSVECAVNHAMQDLKENS